VVSIHAPASVTVDHLCPSRRIAGRLHKVRNNVAPICVIVTGIMALRNCFRTRKNINFLRKFFSFHCDRSSVACFLFVSHHVVVERPDVSGEPTASVFTMTKSCSVGRRSSWEEKNICYMVKLEEIHPVGTMGWAKWRGVVTSQSHFSSLLKASSRKCASGQL